MATGKTLSTQKNRESNNFLERTVFTLTTGLAVIFFGWAGVIYEILYIFKGEGPANKFIDNVFNTYGAFVQDLIMKIFG